MFKPGTHVHFMGIGGIGMSALAIVLKQRGYIVSGCDLDLSQQSVHILQNMGCPVSSGHCSSVCDDQSISVLVYTACVKPDHPELSRARACGVQVLERAQLLAELMREKKSVGVAGAHGKTTTSALAAHVLVQAGLNPTGIIGGHCKNFDTNAWTGAGDTLVAECCESDRTLAILPAHIAVITNIDREHLDAYKDLDDIISVFAQFARNTPENGCVVACADDPGVQQLLPHLSQRVITYGLESGGNYYVQNLVLEPQSSRAHVYENGNLLGELVIPIAGKHNVLNSLAVVAAARELGVSFDTIAKAVANFAGVDRRFCYHGDFQGAQVFDDYGHHPTEIAATLAVARSRAKNKLHVIFQPHRFTRTKFLWEEFVKTFTQGAPDTLVITDIYPASEPPIPGITSEKLVSEINHGIYLPIQDDFLDIKTHLARVAQPGDLILLLGAGKVFKLAKELVA